MPTTTFTPLATVSLTGTDSEILFSSIPNTYRDLVLIGSLRTNFGAASEPLRIRFNGDSTSGNYKRVAMSGNGSSPSAYTDSPGEVIVDVGATAASATSGQYSSFRLDALDYAITTKHKVGFTYSDVAAVETRRQTWYYNQTTAISSISIVGYFGGSFVSGSTLSLYGVVA
jgi:hypothetical protein